MFVSGSTEDNAESERKANVVGKRIAEARSAKKLSLSAFAELLTEYGVAVGRSAVYKWETGVTIPSAYQLLAGVSRSTLNNARHRGGQLSVDTIERLCAALDITLGEFFTPPECS